MSMHSTPLTQAEEAGLRAHGLKIGTPSQLSDAFRQGMAYALAAPAQPDTWRAAVLDALISTGGDMPVTATPAEIVRAVIDANVQIALDPRVSDAAPAQQPELWPYAGSIPPGADDIVRTIALALERGYSASEILDENSPIRDRINAYSKTTSPSVQHRKPLTETEMYKVDNDARAQFAESQRGGPRGQQITYWDSLTPWLIRAVERAHGITAAPKDQA